MARPRLVKIPFSHYCEKARWALDRAGVAYDEEKHLPFFHARAVIRAGGRRTVPVLVTDEGVIADSTEILRWCDARVGPAQKLFPEERPVGDEVARWESRFDDELGPHTRRWGYHLLLPDRERTLTLMRKHAPPWEFRALTVAYPVARFVMCRAMRVNAEGAARSLAKVRAVFDDVSAALADGRPYLVGGRFSAADLTFCTLAAPALLPDGYAKWLGGREEAPAALREVLDELRVTPAGRWALKVYAHDR